MSAEEPQWSIIYKQPSSSYFCSSIGMGVNPPDVRAILCRWLEQGSNFYYRWTCATYKHVDETVVDLDSLSVDLDTAGHRFLVICGRCEFTAYLRTHISVLFELSLLVTQSMPLIKPCWFYLVKQSLCLGIVHSQCFANSSSQRSGGCRCMMFTSLGMRLLTSPSHENLTQMHMR